MNSRIRFWYCTFVVNAHKLLLKTIVIMNSGMSHLKGDTEMAKRLKRTLSIFVIMLLSAGLLAACGSNTSDETTAEDQEQAVTEQTEDVGTAGKTGDALVIYFSAANTKDTDAVTSTTPLGDKDGTTGWIADVISEETGAEVVKITPSVDYPLEYDDAADYAKKEADNDARPAIEPLEFDPTSYKTVFIGYPVWWYKMPMVMETFFDTYDFSGVTIVPFNTHEGSGDGGTYTMIQEKEPDATVLEGLAIRGGNAGEDSASEEIIEWLGSLDL